MWRQWSSSEAAQVHGWDAAAQSPWQQPWELPHTLHCLWHPLTSRLRVLNNRAVTSALQHTHTDKHTHIQHYITVQTHICIDTPYHTHTHTHTHTRTQSSRSQVFQRLQKWGNGLRPTGGSPGSTGPHTDLGSHNQPSPFVPHSVLSLIINVSSTLYYTKASYLQHSFQTAFFSLG